MTNHAVRGKLFEPGRIGPVEMRNRVVLPPMTTRLAVDEGYVTNATVAYFSARAVGGVGLWSRSRWSRRKRLAATVRANWAYTTIAFCPGSRGSSMRFTLGAQRPRSNLVTPAATRERTSVASRRSGPRHRHRRCRPRWQEQRSNCRCVSGHLRRPLPRSRAELVAQEAAYGRVVFLRDKHRCEVATGS